MRPRGRRSRVPWAPATPRERAIAAGSALVAVVVVWLFAPPHRTAHLAAEPVAPERPEPQTIRIAQIQVAPPEPVLPPAPEATAEPIELAAVRIEELTSPERPSEVEPEPPAPEPTPVTPEPESQLPPEPELQASELLESEPPRPELQVADPPESDSRAPEPRKAARPTPEPRRPERSVAESRRARERPVDRAPELEPLDDVAIAIGRHRIAEGRFPRQRASYARIGFPAYRDAMLALGGAFFLFDARTHRPLAELDPFTLRHRPVRDSPPQLSAWPRDVTSYLRHALEDPAIRAAYRGRANRVVLLPPAEVDAAIVGGLDRALRRRGVDIERVARVRLVYALTAGGLEAEVSRIALFDGTEQELALRLALSGPIPRSGGRS